MPTPTCPSFGRLPLPRSLLGVASILSLGAAIACSSPESSQQATTDTSDLTSTTAYDGLCADPVPSDDGRFALLYFCETGTTPSKLARLDLATLSLQTISNGLSIDVKSFSLDSSPLGAKNGNFYVISQRPGGWSIELRNWDLTTSRRVDVESLIQDPNFGSPGDAFFTNDGSTLLVSTRGGRKPRVIVTSVSTAATAIDLDNLVNPRVISAPDSKSVLLIDGAEVSKLDLVTLKRTAAVRGPSDVYFIDSSFDGSTVVAGWQEGASPNKLRVVGALSVETGTTSELVRDNAAHTSFGGVLRAAPGVVDYWVPNATPTGPTSTIVRTTVSGGAPIVVSTVAGTIKDWYESSNGDFAFFRAYDPKAQTFQTSHVAMSAGATVSLLPSLPTFFNTEEFPGWTRRGDELLATAVPGDKDPNDLVVRSASVNLTTGAVTPRETLRYGTLPTTDGLGQSDYGTVSCKSLPNDAGLAERQSAVVRFDGTAITYPRTCANAALNADFVMVPNSEAILLAEQPDQKSEFPKRVTVFKP